jgi:Ca-activated chloride channel family protein
MSRQMSSERPSMGIVVLIWLVAILMMVGDADAGEGPSGGELELSLDGGRLAVPAVTTLVDLDVTGPLIRAEVRQEFINPTAEVVSARYVYPLPEGAAVAAMEMTVGARRIVSVVKEHEAAQAVYEQARREGRKAALVSGLRPNIFATDVANIGPGEKITVRLEYLDQAAWQDGWFSLVVPLTFTPRYVPAAGTEMAAGSATALSGRPDPVASVPFVPAGHPDFPRAGVTVDLGAGLELADILCSSHAVRTRRDGDQWRVELQRSFVPADRDFVLRWRPEADPLARPLLFREDTPNGTYALLMVVPGTERGAPPRPPVDTIFVLDVSGSMGGSSLAQAQAALATAIANLRPGDRFNVLAFADRTTTCSSRLHDATPETRRAARSWVSRLEAGGGTQMHPALLEARLLCDDQEFSGRARQVILLTDAAVGNEDQLLRQTVARYAGVRLHVVGIGSAPNRHLVRRLAGEGGGLSIFVGGADDDPARMMAFLERIGRPQWVDPRLDWGDLAGVVGYPAQLPAPVPGELLLWSGRFPAGTDPAGRLLAGAGERDMALDLALDLATIPAPRGAGLATRWGQMKVDDLMAALDSGGDHDALRGEIVATALDHGLVTRFTSRVAVEERPSVAVPGDTRNVASGLPAGSQLMNALPAGGTLDRLWRALGIVLLLTAAAGLMAGRRYGRPAGQRR